MKRFSDTPRPHQAPLRAITAALAVWAAANLPAQVTIISDFNDGIKDFLGPSSAVTAVEANGELTLSRQIEARPDCPFGPPDAVSWPRALPIGEGQTLVLEVELLELDGNNGDVSLDYGSPGENGSYGGYSLNLSADAIWLAKFQGGGCGGCGCPHLFNEIISIRNNDVTLRLSLTGAGNTVILKAQVLDLHNSNAVLYERSVIDGPGIDPTAPEFKGVPLPDDFGGPFVNGEDVYLQLRGRTDSGLETVVAVFDNFTYEYRSAVELKIEQTVRLSWPAFSTPFIVEGAPTEEGPWTPIQEPVQQINAMNWMTVPPSLAQTLRVFRLRETF